MIDDTFSSNDDAAGELVVLQPDLLIAPSSQQEAVAQNPALVYLAGLMSSSRRTVATDLSWIAAQVSGGQATIATFPWAALRRAHVQAIRAHLAAAVQARTIAPATANKRLTALRSVIREAWRLGQLSTDDYQRAVDVQAVKGTRLAAGRALTAGEVLELLRVCGDDATVAGVRDGAVLAVMLGGGLRRAEVAGLRIEDYRQEERVLKVRGKGDRERLVPLPTGTGQWLADWLTIRGAGPGALFCGLSKAGRLTLADDNHTVVAMTDQAIYNLLQRRVAQTSLKESVSPHDLRRTCLTELLERGAGELAVAQISGHQRLDTLKKYDRRGLQAAKRAAELLHIPHERG